MMQPTILVDAMNLVFRAHWSHQNLSDQAGEPTGLTYGFLKTLLDLRKTISQRIIVAWDHGTPVLGAERPRNWRDSFLPTYKATRKHDDAEWPRIVGQLSSLNGAIRLLGYSSIAVMGLEADDVIGILSQELPGDVLIFSTDKDFYQLLSDRVQILVPKKDKNGFHRVTAQGVEEQYGIPVSRWAEYLALGGDGSDNIKPMRGMGPKTAIKLIQSGTDLNRNLCDQPEMLRSKYGSVWNEIQNSYHAARIPTSWKDPRVKECVGTWNDLFPNTDQSWKDKEQSRQAFARFCAERDMATLLAAHREFFTDSNEESKPECTTIRSTTKPRNLTARRSLFR